MIITSDNRNIDIYKHNATTSRTLSVLSLLLVPDFPVSMSLPFCPKPYNYIKNNENETPSSEDYLLGDFEPCHVLIPY